MIPSTRISWIAAVGSSVCAPTFSVLFSYVRAEIAMATVAEGLAAIPHIFIGATGGSALGAAAGAGLLARLGLRGSAGNWVGPAATVTVAYCVGGAVYLVLTNFIGPFAPVGDSYV